VAAGGLVAVQPVTANAPNPKTEAGLRCLLGLGPDGCWRRFETPYARQNIKYCAGEDWFGTAGLSDVSPCPSGPLESIEYLGINATGDDVYSVKFMHRNDTYILPPPGPDGKIATRCVFNGPPEIANRVGCLGGHITLSAKVTPPVQARILYKRPGA